MTSGETGRDLLREPLHAASPLPDIVPPVPETDDDRDFIVGVTDTRLAVVYLTAPGSDEYIAVMDVLEASVTDMTPADVVTALGAAGHPLDEKVVVARLDKLRKWTAVSARTDNARILRYSDIVARNWRYTPTPVGRQVQRFYKSYLSGVPLVREIPLTNLRRLVDTLEQLAGLVGERPNADFHAASSTLGLAELEVEAPPVPPGDGGVGRKAGLAQDG